ncbi:UNVERIFIED_CONTAM: hypothetical protein FKN15_026153 [Acipenser sinensis]
MGGRGRRRELLQQQPQLKKRWWSRVPSQFGPPDWAAEQEQWRAEGAPMCEACGEFGHDRVDCPYGDPQYEEAWNQGLVGDAAEWFWVRNQAQPTPKREEPECPAPEWEEPECPAPEWEEPERPAPEWEEPERPAPEREEPERPAPEWEEPERPTPEWEEPERPVPEREEPERPQPKRGESVRPQPKSPPAEGEFLLVPPPQPWEDCVSLPPPPAEGEFLLVLPPPPWEDCVSLPPSASRG